MWIMKGMNDDIGIDSKEYIIWDVCRAVEDLQFILHNAPPLSKEEENKLMEAWSSLGEAIQKFSRGAIHAVHGKV